MTRVTRTRRFNGQFKRRANQPIPPLFAQRLILFQKNPHDPSLRAHALRHDLEGLWSFSLTADEGPDDYRASFRKAKVAYVFVDFGTHDQLYRPWRRP